MVKKIVISGLVFLVVFIVSLLSFLSFDAIAKYYITNELKRNNIPVEFQDITVTFFETKVKGIVYKDLKFDSVTLSYNPLGLLFGRLSFVEDSSYFIANGKVAGSDISIDAKLSMANIAKSLNYSGSGTINLKGNYNIKTSSGTVLLSGGAVSFQHPLMSIEVDSISGDIAIKGNSININKLSTTGKSVLESSGLININPKRINYSSLDIDGSVALGGMNLDFTLTGTLAAPQFKTGR